MISITEIKNAAGEFVTGIPQKGLSRLTMDELTEERNSAKDNCGYTGTAGIISLVFPGPQLTTLCLLVAAWREKFRYHAFDKEIRHRTQF